jgi:ubiquinone/menaquinone biosynthesis C-methylase UbiE
MNGFSAYRKTLNFHVEQLKDSHNVLDDGCGTGNLTLRLMLAKHKVSAIDPNPEAIAQTLAKCVPYTLNNVDIQPMDGENLTYQDNTFDGISSMFVVPFTNNTQKYISEMYRVAKPGGKIVISAWPPKQDEVSLITLNMFGEFRETGLLPRFQTEWEYFLRTSKINMHIVKSKDENMCLQDILKTTGFTKIHSHDNNPYENYATFITCSKPA